jgi:hypothetical protein
VQAVDGALEVDALADADQNRQEGVEVLLLSAVRTPALVVPLTIQRI